MVVVASLFQSERSYPKNAVTVRKRRRSDEQRRRRARLAFDKLAAFHVKRMMDAIERAIIIKSVLGFRQFLLRGLDQVRGESRLVTMACNMKRMFALA